MNTILCIDTASPEIAIALAVDGAVVECLGRDATMDHSRVLLATIDQVLGERRNALSGIAVVRGPGSYAGLRVGLATAQGLALARGIPIRGISTLEAVARAAARSQCTAIHPAGRGEFAAQHFQDLQPNDPIYVATPNDLVGLAVAGEGAGALGGAEVTPEQRCRAALLALLPAFGSGANAEVDALYLREPNITLPRNTRAPASSR